MKNEHLICPYTHSVVMTKNVFAVTNVHACYCAWMHDLYDLSATTPLHWDLYKYFRCVHTYGVIILEYF